MQSSGQDDGDGCDFLFKIILIGDSNVGKTCVIHSFKSGLFSDSQHNTIGVDFDWISSDVHTVLRSLRSRRGSRYCKEMSLVSVWICAMFLGSDAGVGHSGTGAFPHHHTESLPKRPRGHDCIRSDPTSHLRVSAALDPWCGAVWSRQPRLRSDRSELRVPHCFGSQLHSDSHPIDEGERLEKGSCDC